MQVGGLGDVVTALGRAVQEAGNLVEVILPRSDASQLLALRNAEHLQPHMPCSLFRHCADGSSARALTS